MAETTIDDTDPSVAYAGNWQLSTQDLRSFHNTVHFTNAINSTATLTFTGVGVSVFGSVRASETPQSSYSIDGGDATIFKATSAVISQYGVLFYATQALLRDGQHTLTIKNLNNNTLFIDDFTVVTTGATQLVSSTFITSSSITSSSTSPSSISRSGSSSSSQISITPGPIGIVGSGDSNDVPSATSFPEPAATRSRSAQSRAAIIGPVAAAAIVIIFAFIFLLLRRRRKKMQEEEDSLIFANSGRGAAFYSATFTPSLPTFTMAHRPIDPPTSPSNDGTEPPPYHLVYTRSVQDSGFPLTGDGGRLKRG